MSPRRSRSAAIWVALAALVLAAAALLGLLAGGLGEDLDGVDDTLQSAIQAGSVADINLALRGASQEAIDQGLIWAIEGDQIEAFAQLLKRGAILPASSQPHATAIDIASRRGSSQERLAEWVAALNEAVVDPCQANRPDTETSQTAAELAESHGYRAVAAELRDLVADC